MGQGIWIDSEKLSADDSIEEILKHGTLSVGFIGLAENIEGTYRCTMGKVRKHEN